MHSVFVWTVGDLMAAIFFGFIFACVGVIFLCQFAADVWDRTKQLFKKRQS